MQMAKAMPTLARNEKRSSRSTVARRDLSDSVDTVHLVQRIPKRPSSSELLSRGFRSKAGNLPNSTTWYHNASKAEHRGNLTIYENYGPGYGMMVSASLPKFCRGANLHLIDDG